jgi:hypothetical protein
MMYLVALRTVSEEGSLDQETQFSIEIINIEADVLEIRGKFSVVADGKEHKFKDPIDTIMLDDGNYFNFSSLN